MEDKKSMLNSCDHIICIDCVKNIKDVSLRDLKKYFQCPYDRQINLTATQLCEPNRQIILLPSNIIEMINNSKTIVDNLKSVLNLISFP